MTRVTEIRNTAEAVAFYTDSARKLEDAAGYLRLGAGTDLSAVKHLLAIAGDIRRDMAPREPANQTATTLDIRNMAFSR